MEERLYFFMHILLFILIPLIVRLIHEHKEFAGIIVNQIIPWMFDAEFDTCVEPDLLVDFLAHLFYILIIVIWMITFIMSEDPIKRQERLFNEAARAIYKFCMKAQVVPRSLEISQDGIK